ncbi:MAG TPA: S-layer homology domain-containing protein, partial [Candidatus Intestinimonas stercoravium]|nr:S-layer homology domain-containing protein [Candidatus Intestinimonas stercoravium]
MTYHECAAKKVLSLTVALAMGVSLCALPTFAAEGEETAPSAVFLNTSDDGGDNTISLTAERSFTASIPVDMTLEEAQEAAGSIVWSLDYDESQPYVDPELFPNHSEGGELEDWLCSDGETPLFSNVATTATEEDGQVYVNVSFDNGIYFYAYDWSSGGYAPDASAPHSNGGAYLDVCGWYDLSASLDGEELGQVAVKVAPYDDFHTMQEIYDSIDELVAYAEENTDIYVGKYSMGSSQGDNGMESLDMPYLIIARDEAVLDKWQAIKEQAETDPTSLIEEIEDGTLTDYQVPVMYSNVHANEVAAADGVLTFAWMLVETAASESGTIDYDRLTGFTAEGEAELAEQMGPVGEEGSLAIPDLVADTATYLGYIKGEEADGTTSSESVPVDLEKYYTIETETVDIDALLDDVFFIIVPEENVEGRTYVTRTSSGGFDLNRDNSFQTQAETQNMTRLIAEWNPVSFAEFHGRVEQFQCEPCDPPHEPNFEYDLLAEHLMAGGEALGIAAVANNDGHNSYVIPQRDYLTYTGEQTADGEDQTQWLDPWDDMSTSYTPQYAMLHGTVSYTVEVPAYDDYMVQGVAYGQLGQSNYIAQNKESYLLNQTKIFERGVTNANSDAYELVGQWFADQYDVEGAEAELFRPEYDGEGQNGNFYPECYIIPLDGEEQSNLQAADEMLEYLTRNGVDIMIADEAFTYDGVEYPAGTAVVSMYQAKRSVANGVLYDGTVITEWPVLYSEGITAFNYTRGFDMITCAEPAAYAEIAAACSVADDWTVSSAFSGTTGGQVVLTNASEDSTAAVNALLQAGKDVALITEGAYKGSFLVSYADWQSVAGDYLITGIGVDDVPAARVITKVPVIYISGYPSENTSGFYKSTLVSGAYQYNYDRQAMELLGFATTDDAAEADLIIGAAALDDQALAAVQAGTPYIGYGSNAMRSATSLFEDGALVRQTAGSSAMDALAYVTYPTESLITASYVAEGDDVLYGYGAGYFETIPEGAQVLIQLDSSKGLLEGFLPSTGAHYADFLDDSIQAISYQGEGADGADLNVVLFANTLTNKVHQRDEFNFVSNAAFVSVLGDEVQVPEEPDVPEEPTTGDDNDTEDSSTVVTRPGESGGSGSETPDEPGTDIDEPETPLAPGVFTDVPAGHWASEAIEYVTGQGYFNGTSETTFGPSVPMSRAMLATVLWRMEGQPA